MSKSLETTSCLIVRPQGTRGNLSRQPCSAEFDPRVLSRVYGTRRRGVVLLCVLVCLLITSSLAMSLIQSALQNRRECKRIEQLYQTECLLDAGVMRAASQLRLSDSYQGEIWSVGDAFDGLPSSASYAGAVVRIEVDRQQSSQPTEVTVTALIEPTDGAVPAVRSTEPGSGQSHHLLSPLRTQRTHRFQFTNSSSSTETP